jgi:flagellar L-ring protein precursor FlgH
MIIAAIARACLLAGLGFSLAGCAMDVNEIGREPQLTPVGTGLNAPRVPVSSEPNPRPAYRGDNSLWQDASADLFRDRRATKIGDVLTVKISMRDKASLDNSTDRKRDSSVGLNFDYGYNFTGASAPSTGDGEVTGNVDRTTETKGEGAIARSENIELLVAAVVTDVMPNGNLVIAGSQEVRVNYELRVLHVSGIVRPRDISSDSGISYEKIAEARISYGGRGRIMEVQQPGWGHQIVDTVLPF